MPPIGKQKRYPALNLTVIHAEERVTPKNRKKIEWKLITDLPVGSRADTIDKLEWYVLRWKIEVSTRSSNRAAKRRDRSSGPPGNMVMWRGLSRLTDIALGAMVGAEIVGN